MPEEKRAANLERLRGLSERELVEELGQHRARLFELRRQNTTKQLENTSAIPQTKKQIARILTLERERALAVKGE